MADLETKPATCADIEALPANVVGEIIFGALQRHPRPPPGHVVASSSPGGELIGPFQKGAGGPGGWIFADEPELHLAPHVLVSDIAAWRRETLTALPAAAYFETAPDWICEVLSPATEKYDRGDKRPIYAAFEVDHLWLPDPAAQFLEVFQRPGQGKDWLLTPICSRNTNRSTRRPLAS